MDGSCGYVSSLINVPCLNVLPFIVLSSDYWVDLNELYIFMKRNYGEADKKEIQRRNSMKTEICNYEFCTREYQE